MNRTTLENDLLSNVLVLEFNRRTDPKGKLRRMICTKSDYILSSTQGRFNLNFRNPKFGGPKYDESKTNTVVVWDILTQDYRQIPCESVRVIDIIPEKLFWKYFNEQLRTMSKRDKVSFMHG